MARRGTIGEPVSITRKCTLRFDGFGSGALDDYEGRNGKAAARFIQLAASYFLAELDAGRLTRQVPRLPLRPRERRGEFELSLTESEWDRLEAEAERQGIKPERLLEHATIRFLADLDAGRVTERLVRALDAGPRPRER